MDTLQVHERQIFLNKELRELALIQSHLETRKSVLYEIEESQERLTKKAKIKR